MEVACPVDTQRDSPSKNCETCRPLQSDEPVSVSPLKNIINVINTSNDKEAKKDAANSEVESSDITISVVPEDKENTGENNVKNDSLEFEGFAVTPVGSNTSYKGVPSSQLLLPNISQPHEPPKARGNSKARVKSNVRSADQSDKNSFTRKLQQFLSSSKSLFSPQSKVLEATDEQMRENIQSYSSKTKRSIPFETAKDASDNIDGTKDVGSEETKKNSDLESTKAGNSIVLLEGAKVDTEAVEADDFEKSSSSNLALSSLKYKLFDGLASPKSSKNSGDTSVDEAAEIRVDSKSDSKIYSRDVLMRMSKCEAAKSKPVFSNEIEASVSKDLQLGYQVCSKYSPIKILSRDFKLKYKL